MEKTVFALATASVLALSTLSTANALPIHVEQDPTYQYINAASGALALLGAGFLLAGFRRRV